MTAARLYSVEEVGVATALISSLGLVILFSRLGFDVSIIRFFPTGDKARIFSTSLIITTAASLLVGAACVMLAEFLSPSLAFLKEPGCVIVFLLIGTVNSVAAITGNAFVADRKTALFFQNHALRIPLLIPMAFLLFGSVGLGYLVASFIGLLTLQRSIAAIKPQVNRDFICRSFQLSSWNYVSSILSAAPSLIMPIMILNMFGEAEAAKYYIAFAIGNLVLIIPNSLGTSLLVEGSHGEGLKQSVLRAVYASLALLVPAVLVLFLFGDRLLGMLKWEYVEAFDLLRIIALSSFPVAVYSLFVPIQNVRMKAESIVTLNALRCMFLLGLSYILMQRNGILGAGYAWLATYVIIMLVIGWMAKREGWI